MREQVVRGQGVCVSKLCGDKLCVSKLCVSKLCGDKLCVSKLCGDKRQAAERRGEARRGGVERRKCTIKNKNPTQRCCEKNTFQAKSAIQQDQTHPSTLRSNHVTKSRVTIGQ